MNTDLIKYYKDRAKEYENIYLKPERQDDLKNVTTLLQNVFTDKAVFEIACGTGFWTEKIAQTATKVFATDINKTVIDIAQQKQYKKNNVTFGLADIFILPNKIKYESLFGGFIWSHIKLQDLDNFLNTVNNLTPPGGMVVFIDNNFVEGSNHSIVNTDQNGNTYQSRKLEDGTTHLVLKNFPTESFLRTILADIATDLKIINFKYYWVLTYNTRTEKGNR
ncbi:MAG TPA: class I SAM-dependent methyltransferase [Bacteroidia bacterium]|nr:class I SAM-dependent methyltransferase [Bacteroidia bacterium]